MQMENDIVRVVAVGYKLLLSFYVVGNYYMAHYKLPTINQYIAFISNVLSWYENEYNLFSVWNVKTLMLGFVRMERIEEIELIDKPHISFDWKRIMFNIWRLLEYSNIIMYYIYLLYRLKSENRINVSYYMTLDVWTS